MEIYRILNIVNGKSYIGQTCFIFEHRYRNGKWWKRTKNVALKRAFLKYGLKAFKVQILKKCRTKKSLDFWENFYIQKYNTIAHGYNFTTGGSRGKHSAKSKLLISKSKMGIKYSEAYKLKMALVKSGKPFKAINKDNKIMYCGRSISECARLLKTYPANISRCLHNKRPHHKGVKFIFEEK